MKKILFGFTLVLAGCCGVPDETRVAAEEHALVTEQFVKMMDAGVTTREVEQDFIRAQQAAWEAQHFALNDVEPEKAEVEVADE